MFSVKVTANFWTGLNFVFTKFSWFRESIMTTSSGIILIGQSMNIGQTTNVIDVTITRAED